jgi:hypothetical protein
MQQLGWLWPNESCRLLRTWEGLKSWVRVSQQFPSCRGALIGFPTVEIQVTHVGPDLQFLPQRSPSPSQMVPATAAVARNPPRPPRFALTEMVFHPGDPERNEFICREQNGPRFTDRMLSTYPCSKGFLGDDFEGVSVTNNGVVMEGPP